MLGEFENAALFLRLGLTSTLILHEHGAFWKRSSNRRNLKTPALCFSVDGKYLKTELFENDDIALVMWFPYYKSNMTGFWCVFKFLRRSVDKAKHTSFFPRSRGILWLVRAQFWIFAGKNQPIRELHESLLSYVIVWSFSGRIPVVSQAREELRIYT